MFDALAVVVEGLRAIAEVHGAVKCSMGFDERGRHGEGVVKIGERGIGEFFAGVEDSFRVSFDSIRAASEVFACGDKSGEIQFGSFGIPGSQPNELLFDACIGP